MLQQRAWCFSANDNGSTVLLAFRTAKDFLDILDPFHFCRGDSQFLTDNLFPDDFHRSIAVGAVPVLVRHCTWDFDHRQSCQDLFPGSFRFPCLAVITTDGFFQSWFRNRWIRGSFCLIEQIYLPWKYILLQYIYG